MNRVFTYEEQADVATAEAAAVAHFFDHLRTVGATSTCSVCTAELPLMLRNVHWRQIVQTCSVCGWRRFFDPSAAGLVPVDTEGLSEPLRTAWLLPDDAQALLRRDLARLPQQPQLRDNRR